MGAGFGPPIGLVSRNLCPNCRDRICYSEQNLKMGISISWLKGEEVAFRLMKEAKGRPNNTYRVEPYLSESQIALSWHPTLGRLWSAEQTTNRASVSRETEAILALQVHLKSSRLSKMRRGQLEVDLYNRIHNRYVAVHALKQFLSR
jgi:hypothetical protein